MSIDLIKNIDLNIDLQDGEMLNEVIVTGNTAKS